MISNILRLIINISGIRNYYYFFFKNFFNKFVLVNRVGRMRFLDLGYKKENLSFKDKKLKGRG